MKVYRVPDELPAPKLEFPFDTEKHLASEEAHKAALKAWLIKSGYKGKHTGEVVRFPVADGYAQYMLADGKKSFLIHLPYCDAYDYRDVQYLPKAEILRRIEVSKKMAALFSKAT